MTLISQWWLPFVKISAKKLLEDSFCKSSKITNFGLISLEKHWTVVNPREIRYLYQGVNTRFAILCNRALSFQILRQPFG